MINFIIDIVVIAIFCFFIIKGKNKGLFKSIFEFAAGVGAFIAAFVFYKPVADYMLKIKLVKNISDSVSDNIANNLKAVPKFLADSFAGGITKIAVQIIAIILIYIVVRILFTALIKVFEKMKTPVVGKFNALGGACFGFINAALIIYISMMVIMLLASLDKSGDLESIMQATNIAKIFYKNNLLLELIY